jgi:3D (Asp-Asp-Asp) domain-containing protein
MNNLKLKLLFTVLIAWSTVLLFTMSNVSDEKEISDKSIISVDNVIGRVYIEYTDDLQLIESSKLAIYQQELKKKRQAELIAKREAKNKEKIEQQKNQTQVASISRGQANSTKTYVYVITAYTAGYESTGKRKGDKGYGVTTSGEDVKENRTLACPRSIPFGTKIEIEGYGIRVCEDRGGHIVNGRLDIYMENLNDALEFGRRTLQVKIYN